MSSSTQSIEEAMAAIEAAAGAQRTRPARPHRPKKKPFRPGRALALLVVLLLLPFWVLVRGATALAVETGAGPWMSLVGAVLATTALIALYGFVAGRRLGLRPGKWLPRASLAVVGAYCVYGLLFLSPRQFKSASVQETYTSLHPAIRLALATMVLVDSDAVITDGARQPEDYGRMNLPVNQRSLHYAQESGYVHAVDLRTIGRPEWLNTATRLYLRSVGLEVLRHTGTADHFHVYLPVR
ncbi:MAG: hypothetical protein JJ896_10600 [Rhodothermales bacterium]|nr:hypothetical protein [Rhodothermales bacterium]MBO6780091.1 hypothetical protein [Rhodothermales bacterium]